MAAPAKSTLLTVRRAARLAASELRANDEDAALRIVTQAFGEFDQLGSEAERAAFFESPSSTGDRRFDVLIAALVRWKTLYRNAPPPAWTEVAPLEAEWMPGTVGDPLPEWRDHVRRETPAVLREMNIIARSKSWTIA